VILPKSSNEERQARNIMLDGLTISNEDVKEIDHLRIKHADLAFK
jgi:diketogulonate reductase-like aldo/keto reductase